MVAIRKTIGDLPLLPGSATQPAAASEGNEESKGAGTPAAKGPRVLADGTYASQSAAADVAAAVEAAKAEVCVCARACGYVCAAAVLRDVQALTCSICLRRPQNPVRALLLKGNYFVGSAVSATLTKLALRMAAVHGATSQTAKSVMADAVLVMSAILELGQSPAATAQIDQVCTSAPAALSGTALARSLTHAPHPCVARAGLVRAHCWVHAHSG